MKHFINYQYLLKHMEMKTKASIKERFASELADNFLIDGNRLVVFSPETLYLESLKVDTKLRN